MLDLSLLPSLAAYQDYVAQMEQQRGFAEQTVVDKCLLLGEEMGELFKAIRRVKGLALDPESAVGEVSDELADVFIYLCAIANRQQVDLAQAFARKELKNQQRQWVVNEPSEVDAPA